MKAVTEIGPTVADQATYDLPLSYYRALKLAVAGQPYTMADSAMVDEITFGNASLRVGGFFYESFDDSGTEQIALYPTPTSAGDPITLKFVMAPPVLENPGDTPVVDESSHRAIVDYAASKAFASLEDNPDLRGFYEDEFEKAVSQLRHLRRSRTGRGPRTIRIAGLT